MISVWKEYFIRKVAADKKGSMLILSLMFGAVIVVFSAAYLGSVAMEARLTEKSHRNNLAIHLAESGAEEAIWEIKYGGGDFLSGDGWTGTNPKIKTASLTTASGENLGQYTVSVTDPTSSTVIIEATGTALYGTSTLAESRTVEVTVNQPSSATFTMAAFAEVDVTMASNACTDSFDSSNGPYDRKNNSGSDGDVGTNSTSDGAVALSSNADIDGDAFVGVGGDVSTGISTESNATISGTESVLAEAVEIPAITGPTGLPIKGNITYDDDNNHTISTSGEYVNLAVDGNTSVTLDGNVVLYVTNAFTLDSNSELIVMSGSDVEIYVDGSIYFSSNTAVNNLTQDPSRLKIYGTDSLTDNGDDAGIRFHSNTDIYATIVARNSTVHLDSNAEVFGAVMAQSILLDSNTCVHYDTVLGEGSSSGSEGSVSSWQEK